MGSIHYKVIVISAAAALFIGACTVEPTDQVILTTPTDQVVQEDEAMKFEVRRHEILQMYETTAKVRLPRSRMAHYTVMPAAAEVASLRTPSEPVNRENYAHFSDNPLHRVAEDPFSTFSIDIDTGAYSNMRRMLNAGNRPVKDAIRTEELINYYSYDYPRPKHKATPFSIITEVGPSPWNSDTNLLHIGIQGYDISLRPTPMSSHW